MENRVSQDFVCADGKRRNTISFSENGKIETYVYNDQLLTEQVIYADGTCMSCEYSDRNLKTAEISRSGARTVWEYDDYDRMGNWTSYYPARN